MRVLYPLGGMSIIGQRHEATRIDPIIGRNASSARNRLGTRMRCGSLLRRRIGPGQERAALRLSIWRRREVVGVIGLYLTGFGATPPAAFRFRSPQFAKWPPGGVRDGPSSGSVIGAPKKSAPGPPPVVLCKRHGRVKFLCFI